MMRPETLTGLAPELLHHLALYFGRLGALLTERSPNVAVGAIVRANAAWLALEEEGKYLSNIATTIAGADATRVAAHFAMDRIDELGGVAEAASTTLDQAGQVALRALASVPTSCLSAGVSQAIERRAVARARARRGSAVDLAVERVRRAVLTMASDGAPANARATELEKVIHVWAWSDKDELVEQVVAEELQPIGWELYHAANWDGLRRALAPFRAVIDSLAARIERNPDKIAYAAGCAEILMFTSETESTIEKQIAAGERTLRVCPTHRNGRLVMASYLCDKATRSLDVPWVTGEVARTAEALVARAEQLYPASKSLPEARERLEAAKARLGRAFWGTG